MDVVYNLVHVKRFFKYNYEEKIEIKKKGRPLPSLTIESNGYRRGKMEKRHFSQEIYNKNKWICGCNQKNALFCFPCLLFSGEKAWTEVGVTDLMHLSEKLKIHENSRRHIYNSIELALLGTDDITSQLSPAYWKTLKEHNENVMNNRYILSKLINYIKFCGVFDLALQDQNEFDMSQNSKIFRGLINFSTELDSTLGEQLKNASVFKGNFKEILNDVLHCMHEVYHEEVIKQIKRAPFLAVIVDETIDVSEKTQLAVILRYTLNGEPVERFWSYLKPEKYDAETISKTILKILDTLIENSPHKLIAQSYDGAAVISGQHAEIQAKIKEKYPFAHFVHSYEHHLNFIMSKAASVHPQVRVFFGNLQDIPAFFNNSPQHVEEVLNKIVRRKNTYGATPRWNFDIRTVNVVFKNRESLIECMEEIVENFNQATVCSAANSIRRTLQDPMFVFWLTFFHHVMPHVDILFDQIHKNKNDATHAENLIHNFEQNIVHIRSTVDDIFNQASYICAGQRPFKRDHLGNGRFDIHDAAIEVCEIITNSVNDRFIFNDHIVAASLFFPELFVLYSGDLPEHKITTVCSAYPPLEKERLCTELSVIYSRNDCRQINGALQFLKFLILNNLDEIMKETRKLLEIVVTTPMNPEETKHRFSTLNQIKTFLHNTMSKDFLITLSMIFIENKFISQIDNFNDMVIEKFAIKKDLTMELTLKNQNDKQEILSVPKKHQVKIPEDKKADFSILAMLLEQREEKVVLPICDTNEATLKIEQLENEELHIKEEVFVENE